MRVRTGVKAHGRIVSWEGASLWLLEVPAGGDDFPSTSLHSHHAVQVTLALRGQFDLEGQRHQLRGVQRAAVAPDEPHRFHQKNGLVAQLFIAPESRAGRALTGGLFGDGSICRLSSRTLGDLPARLAAAFDRKGRVDPELIALGRALVACLASQPEAEGPDHRIDRLIAWATHQLDAPITLEDAAQQVGLSAGRLRHLFVEQTGLPFRVFLLWLRLAKAIEQFASGSSLTDAAHGAGFSDSAHFSRTFRRMYGISAASLRVA